MAAASVRQRDRCSQPTRGAASTRKRMGARVIFFGSLRKGSVPDRRCGPVPRRGAGGGLPHPVADVPGGFPRTEADKCDVRGEGGWSGAKAFHPFLFSARPSLAWRRRFRCACAPSPFVVVRVAGLVRPAARSNEGESYSRFAADEKSNYRAAANAKPLAAQSRRQNLVTASTNSASFSNMPRCPQSGRSRSSACGRYRR